MAVTLGLLPETALGQFTTADVTISNVDTPDPVVSGSNLAYEITISNNGPDPAENVSLSDTLPAGTVFVSLSQPGGWSCTTPGVGSGGTVSCSIAALAVGTAAFTLTVNVGLSVSDGTVLSNTATVAASNDIGGDNTGTATTTVWAFTRIHDIQGNGASSPIVGSSVRIHGIVTGVASNGFFVQEEDADADADPMTSEGIFVFTSSAPPTAAAFTAQVMVTGTVSEFVPGSDPQQPPSTQMVSSTSVQTLPPGQPLPTPAPLTPTFPDPAGQFDQLEAVEHMRVSASSITVTGPSAGTVDEAAATGTSNGRFHGVITGVARPFREAGIQAPDVPPSGTIPPIPRWDSNPERLRIESAAINSQPILTVKTGDVVTNVVGPLTYSERGYAILPDGVLGTAAIVPGTLPTVVSAPTADEVTVVAFNLQRFYDTFDDPAIAEPVLSAAAYQNRLAKASIAVRTHLHNPDIIGVQSVENLSVLQDLAQQIASDGGASYAAFLIEGNASDGLDVGWLVKTDLVPGNVPRVQTISVEQVGASTTWVDPNGNAVLLNDRPPLVLRAMVNRTSAGSVPIVVMVNHLLGLEGIDSQVVNGATTEGDLIRRKRQAQAEFVANYLQQRQTGDPTEPLVVIGDFQALDANDGYADVISVIAGTPPPDNETVVPGDGVDLVNPDLVNLASTAPAAQRYSQVPDGHAWNLDHVLVSAGLVADTSTRRIEHARIGADYPETERNNNLTALRVSNHDPVVAYLALPALVLADVSIAMADAPDPVAAGANLTYTITVTNSGPDAASNVSLSDTLPGDTTFTSLSTPGGWSCATPAVGEGGTVSCSIPSAAVGSAVFTLTVAVPTSTPGGTVLSNTASVTTPTHDPTPGDGSTTSTTTVDGAPTITDIANQTIPEDSSTPTLPFVIGDVGTPAASLALSAGSSDTTIVPVANIVLGGSGANRTVTVAPAPNAHGGPVTITVTVSDGTFVTADTFTVTVSAVNDPPTISDIPNQTIAENTSTGPLPFTIADADGVGTLSVSASSSHPAIVPNANVVLGGTGANRTVTVTPAADQHGGPVTITVTVSDGTVSATDTFLLTVTSDNDPPTVSGVVDATIQESKTLTQTLTVSDDDAVDTLIVTAASSNDALLPDGAAVVTGTGATRTLTLTPIAEQTGETIITVTVSDGELTTTQTARLTVTVAPPPDAPTGLIGTAVGKLVTFTWTAPATGATPTFYVLEGGTAPGATTLPVNNTDSRDTRWTVTLPAGAYSYRVRAANRAGTSGPSNEASVSVGASPQLPGPPSALIATVTGAQVSIQWAPNIVGGAPSQWQIELGSAPGARDRGIFPVPPQITTAAGTLDAGDYVLRVRGVNAAGEGPSSNEVRLRVGAAPACEVPEAPVLLPALVIDQLVQLTWRASRNTAVGNYRVVVGSQPGAADLFVFDMGPVNAFAGLAPLPPPLRQYYVAVVAMNDCGVSQASNTIRVDIGPGPPAPANLRAVVDSARVTLQWDAVPNVDGYVLEVGSAPGLSDLASIPTVTPGYAAAGVPPGTYHVRVRAVRAGATSGPSTGMVLIVP